MDSCFKSAPITLLVEQLHNESFIESYLFQLIPENFERSLSDNPVMIHSLASAENLKTIYILPLQITFKISEVQPRITLIIETTFITADGNPTKLWAFRIIDALLRETMIKFLGKQKEIQNYYQETIFSTHKLELTSDYSL